MFTQAGAGKKKFLTDPVDLIPFPKQNLREKAGNPPRQNVAPVKPSSSIEQTKPEPVTLSAPTGTLSGSMLSIKKLVAKQEEQQREAVNLNDLPHDPYSFDQIKMLWRQFAFEIKSRGMDTFYNAMIKREPVNLDDHQFVLDVDNQVQVDYITPHLQDMNAFFRKSLNNYAINISLRITEQKEEEVKYLTGKDKFMALARKNPNLHTLKNLFNLDIEH